MNCARYAVEPIRERESLMRILLKSLNYAPELTGIGKYNGEMCAALVERGHEVTAIVAPPYYPEWSVHKGYRKFWFQSQQVEGVDLLRCPLYVPEKATTLKRLLHLGSFAVSAGVGMFSRLFKPVDVIVLVQPTLFCAPLTLLFARVKGAKTVLHIQDYEVDALFGLGMMSEGSMARWARASEKWLMSKFDAVSTISLSMIENARKKGVILDDIIHFPNWSDTKFVTPETEGDKLKAEWGFKPDDKIILYAGNIGNKQGLESVIEAAKHFASNDQIKFVFVGAGSYVNELKFLAYANNLKNVFFQPLQPWSKVPEMLAMVDVHLVIQKKGAADAVLPSKLTNILSAGGHAIVTAEEHTELGQIEKQNKGVYSLIEPENVNCLVDSIRKMLDGKSPTYNVVARDFAVQYLNRDSVIDKFVEDLNLFVLNNVDVGRNIACQRK